MRRGLRKTQHHLPPSALTAEKSALQAEDVPSVVTAELQVLARTFCGANGSHKCVQLHSAPLNVQAIATIARDVGDVWTGGCAATQHSKYAQRGDFEFHVNPLSGGSDRLVDHKAIATCHYASPPTPTAHKRTDEKGHGQICNRAQTRTAYAGQIER